MPELFDFLPFIVGLSIGLAIVRFVIRWIDAPMKRNSLGERKPSRVGHIIRELANPTREDKT